LASFLCGFGETKISEYRVIGAKGLLELDPAYTWNEDLKQQITVEGKLKAKKTYKHRGQVAAEISYFCQCLVDDIEPEPSGNEGLFDVMIMEALRRSSQRGKAVRLQLPAKPHPQPAQSLKRKAAKKPRPVKAAPPSRK
jgi:predicted dehydrogenase